MGQAGPTLDIFLDLQAKISFAKLMHVVVKNINNESYFIHVTAANFVS